MPESGDPFSSDVHEAYRKKAHAEHSEEGQVEGEGHGVSAMHGSVQHIHPVGEGQDIREGLQKDRQLLDGKEKPAEENHGETKEIREGLRLKHLADGNGDEKPEEGGGHGDHENSGDEKAPGDPGQIGEKSRHGDGYKGVGHAEKDGPARLRQHKELKWYRRQQEPLEGTVLLFEGHRNR